MTVDVIIPSYRPGEKFERLLAMLNRQDTPVGKIIVINTEEKYWKKERFEIYDNLEVHHIKKEEFDHGRARNMGISFSSADVAVCMTDDAIPADERLISALLMGFSRRGANGEPVIEVYGRQLAGEGSSLTENYTRQFNYPAESRVKTIADLGELGIKTFFASNVCCAYKRELFLKQGGFINRTIFNEDMIFAAGALKAGYAIVYAADAKVVHSHHYKAGQQLHRNFDLGVSQADHPEVFRGVPSEGEGIRLVKRTMRYLMKKKKYSLIPGLILESGMKYAGYQLGKHYKKLPVSLVRKLSMNKNYWDGKIEGERK